MNLNDALTDIARGLDRTSWMPHGLRERGEDDPIWDFRVIPHGTGLYKKVILPDSKPAIEWCWENLPETLDRYTKVDDGRSSHGYILDEAEAFAVTCGMQKAGLMSYEEYQDAEEELSQQAWAQEGY